MAPDLRWLDYVFADSSDESVHFWRAAAEAGGRTLLLCGAGFDPRTLDVPHRVAQSITDLDVLALELAPPGSHDTADQVAATHQDELRNLFSSQLRFVPRVTSSDPSSQSAKLTRALVRDYALLQYDTILLDMSGLPSMVSFAILQLLLTQAGQHINRFAGNLLAIASEDPVTDSRIIASELDEPEMLPGFAGADETAATTIWIPVLGRSSVDEVQALSTFLQPEEVCAVIPFPATDPRTGDDLLLEHRQLLFDELQLEQRNVFYASESNPFDLYRQLVNLADRYRQALRPLGSTAVVVSEHTSKMLGLGVVLAAHERGLSLAHARPMSYRLHEAPPGRRTVNISTAWLLGAPYAV
ncbi:hypothetical protein DEJ16_06905 [Curtobacterium sp. MCJR17_055]|uniref:hypothetical protein n=1 Tax=unclassified Curtobacterium TaxID=257496 RepID=UPI000D90D7E2|nr:MULTISPECIES: hypothetical protein [unclassified Curtobacterium]PYY38033.1 hypothetical protein DEI87_02665 [Curtobacterium sp. MCBD17_029]PYY57057.1 hypothetical protein DEJ16_06905 [Curtobacterium sp. MCJR17_055]PYY62026.1 hypothetical protein DEJ26_00615 [Curtobacterium sp. MCPF17_015]